MDISSVAMAVGLLTIGQFSQLHAKWEGKWEGIYPALLLLLILQWVHYTAPPGLQCPL